MCLKLSRPSPSIHIVFRNKTTNDLLSHRFRRRRRMEMKNLKLHKKNKNMIEENEKLRKKAYLLNQENQALLFQLQNSISNKSVVAS
ncbi:protein LITTLE ZIPPER 3 [Mercurialis annua]|uniref:protein LITTLE ZIPPER 3 n=1 Tax=Mercurialis annua TaxID=3986 RepID=UPI00215E569C|nr:protein LITTLE ZIPPER 3 [Mercurialis annua]